VSHRPIIRVQHIVKSFGVVLSVAFDVAVLLGVGVVFVAAGAWRFSRIEA